MTLSIGLDFGTTNTVATMENAEGGVEALRFEHGGDMLEAFRSVLCFSESHDERGQRTSVDAGPWAIDTFVEQGGDCRFIQSFKTFAASPLFQDTLIYNKRLTFEDLLASFLRQFEVRTGREFPRRVIIGRPVNYAGASPDIELARARYEAALRVVGFEDIHHVYEPVAAAYFFAQRLQADATILVADFGGGTSDFSIVRFVVGARGNGPGKAAGAKSRLTYEPLAHAGVGVAGDAFDSRIIDAIVAPAFGKGSEFTSWGKTLPVPNSYFRKFGRWNELSMMRQSRDYRELQDLQALSTAPELIRAFLAFLDADGGYAMYRAVSAAKMQLSQAEHATLSLHAAGVDIERIIQRRDFEQWISPELDAIEACIDRVLQEAGLRTDDIDRVFLTGGSSFVPAVRAQFDARFGAARIETGDQLVSIAHGLALIGKEPEIGPWTA